MKKYKYYYTGTTAWSVLGQKVRKPGDTIELTINHFRHEWFRPEKESLFSIQKLKGQGKGKTALLIGRGDTCLDNNKLKGMKFDSIFTVNENRTKIKPDYIIYLEIGFVDWINKNLDKISKDVKIIGHQLLLSNRTDYFYNSNDVKEGNGVGFYALQILDKIFNYDKIYLIGFDYDDNSRDWKKQIDDYKSVKWGKVINLNPESKINKNLKGE